MSNNYITMISPQGTAGSVSGKSGQVYQPFQVINTSSVPMESFVQGIYAIDAEDILSLLEAGFQLAQANQYQFTLINPPATAPNFYYDDGLSTGSFEGPGLMDARGITVTLTSGVNSVEITPQMGLHLSISGWRPDESLIAESIPLFAPADTGSHFFYSTYPYGGISGSIQFQVYQDEGAATLDTTGWTLQVGTDDRIGLPYTPVRYNSPLWMQVVNVRSYGYAVPDPATAGTPIPAVTNYPMWGNIPNNSSGASPFAYTFGIGGLDGVTSYIVDIIQYLTAGPAD